MPQRTDGDRSAADAATGPRPGDEPVADDVPLGDYEDPEPARTDRDVEVRKMRNAIVIVVVVACLTLLPAVELLRFLGNWVSHLGR